MGKKMDNEETVVSLPKRRLPRCDNLYPMPMESLHSMEENFVFGKEYLILLRVHLLRPEN